MLDIILLAGLSYALYKMAESYNITPWKWIIRFVATFFATLMLICTVMVGIYGQDTAKVMAVIEKFIWIMEPFILLYQIVLFFFFRARIIRYVHVLDQIDKNNDNNMPNPPTTPGKDQKDFSYFR